MTKVKKIVAGITAIACVGVASIGVATDGFRDWGNMSNVEVMQNPTYQGMVAEQTTARGMSLRMVRASAAEVPEAQAVDTVTVTASLTASGSGYNDDLGWKASFKTNSTWAAGKNVNDYVTMTVASDTHSITLHCKQAFGEPIIITATSVENQGVTASCQLDYVKRLGDVQVTMNGGNTMYWAKENSFEGKVSLGVGTLTPTLTIKDLHVYDDNNHLENSQVAAIFNGGQYDAQANAVGQHQEAINADGTFSGNFTLEVGNFYHTTLTTDQMRRLNNLLLQEDILSDLAFDYLIEAEYNGTVYSYHYQSAGGDWYVPISFEGVSLQTVTGVQLDQSNIIF